MITTTTTGTNTTMGGGVAPLVPPCEQQKPKLQFSEGARAKGGGHLAAPSGADLPANHRRPEEPHHQAHHQVHQHPQPLQSRERHEATHHPPPHIHQRPSEWPRAAVSPGRERLREPEGEASGPRRVGERTGKEALLQ